MSGLIRDVVNTVAETARGAVREIRSGIGKIAIFLGVDSVPFYLDLEVLNRDPAFDRSQPVVSGWNEGKEVTLKGVRVEVAQYIGGVLPALFYSYLDEDGEMNDLKVAKGRTVQSICIAAQNSAAEITSFVTETMVCGNAGSGYRGLGQIEIKTQYGSDPYVPVLSSISPGNLTALNIASDNRFLHLIALLTDSYDYVKTVIGITPTSIEVLKGFSANTLGRFNGGAAFVPCFGHSTAALDTVIAAVSGTFGLIFGPGAAAAAAAVLYSISSAIAVDMILPANNGADSAFNSRGIAVHEYGHVAFCDLLYQGGHGGLYTEMMVSRIESGAAGAADAHLAYINEAFADFFFGQVAGGANYYRPSSENVERVGSIFWCVDETPISTDPATTCFDNNDIQALSPFKYQVGRIASTLHDGFDGQFPRWDPSFPNNADMWVKDSAGHLVYGGHYPSSARDEFVSMTGPCINTVIQKFAQRSSSMRGDLRFLAGLNDAMEDPSCFRYDPVSWCDRCELFANHDDGVAGLASRQEKFVACTSGELATIVGPPPTSDVTNLAGQCYECPIGYRTTDGETCFFDPPIDCPPSELYVFTEGQWRCEEDCPPGQVEFGNGQCGIQID